MKSTELTAERVRGRFAYDPATGLLTRTTGRGNGTINGAGYVQLSIDGKLYLAHRVIWLYVHGHWPSGVIDHINADRADNRLCNLRDVSNAVNVRASSKVRRSNSTGYRGVSYSPYTKLKYQAQIKVDRASIRIGRFHTPEEAHDAYLAAKAHLHQGEGI